MKALAILTGLIAGFIGVLWLIGFAIQGHLHVMANWPGGFGQTVAAGMIFALWGVGIAAVGGIIFIILSVAYLFVEEWVT